MKEQNKLEFLTWIAGIMVTISFSDLVYNVYLTKNTSNLTYTWIFLILSSQILYFIFGLTNNIKGVYIPSIIIILMSLYIFKVKFFLS
jgi:uncharacterized protein with PQ loop repeat